jgi:tetratricopeptide (TPR) repeat protein
LPTRLVDFLTISKVMHSIATLQTLPTDILLEILALSSSLSELRNLILTHPSIYAAFDTRRRLLVRNAYHRSLYPRLFHTTTPSAVAAEIAVTSQRPGVDRIISREDTWIRHYAKITHNVDRVALREALWPFLNRRLPDQAASTWAKELLLAYRTAGLQDDALAFATRTVAAVIAHKKGLKKDAQELVRSVVRLYGSTGRAEEAIAVYEAMCKKLNPRSPDHDIWSKDLIVALRKNGADREVVLKLLLDRWELYCNTFGAGSPTALDWARHVVKEYQDAHNEVAALQFHEKVRKLLVPRTVDYVAWSRQHIHMLQRQQRSTEALATTEEVWRTLRPESTGYLAWTSQLCDMYDTLYRYDKTTATYEAAWSAINAELVPNPKDTKWKHHARGAGAALCKAYRQENRLEEALAIEVRCQELR